MCGRWSLRAAAVAAALAGAALWLALPTGAVAGAARTLILSNERTFTTWAHVAHASAIRARPTTSARRVARLHYYTEDNYPEVYLLLRAQWDSSGREWVKLRIPARPNGQVGWVLRSELGTFHVSHQLVVVNRKRLRLYFYVDGRLIWSAPVGVGTPSAPTPAGHFWIREKFPRLPSSDPYYPYAFGTADYSTLSDWPRGGVVGIHGPYGASNSAIPGRISHGCIRLRVRDDDWLGHHLQVGAALRVI
jgi:hypothetical protein